MGKAWKSIPKVDIDMINAKLILKRRYFSRETWLDGRNSMARFADSWIQKGSCTDGSLIHLMRKLVEKTPPILPRPFVVFDAWIASSINISGQVVAASQRPHGLLMIPTMVDFLRKHLFSCALGYAISYTSPLPGIQIEGYRIQRKIEKTEMITYLQTPLGRKKCLTCLYAFISADSQNKCLGPKKNAEADKFLYGLVMLFSAEKCFEQNSA